MLFGKQMFFTYLYNNKTPEQAKTPPGRKKQQDKNLQDALRFYGEHPVFSDLARGNLPGELPDKDECIR